MSDLRYHGLQENQTPELLRMPLEELYLQVYALGHSDVKEFLLSAPQPPREQAIDVAKDTLIQIDALTDSGDLTALGLSSRSLIPSFPHYLLS